MANSFLAIQPKAYSELQALDSTMQEKFNRLAKMMCNGEPVMTHAAQDLPGVLVVRYGQDLRVFVKRAGNKITVLSIQRKGDS
jgi:hypothetical protein